MIPYSSDRPVAIAAIETRIAVACRWNSYYGVFDDRVDGGIFHRCLLWRRGEDEEELTRIAFLPGRNRKVPSWSWMSRKGGIDYLDPPFGKVEWELAEIQLPEHLGQPEFEVEINEGADIGLLAIARDFEIPGGDENDDFELIYDDDEHESFDEQPFQCVIVAMSRDLRAAPQKTYYVLIVAQIAAWDEARGGIIYERVGVGRLPGSYIALDHPGIEGLLC